MSEKTYTVKLKYATFVEARIEKAQYHDGTLAVVLVDFEGPEKLSVNLEAYYDQGVPKPGPDEFYVKNYSEHEGTPFALKEAGIVELIRPVVFGPYLSAAYLVRLNAEEMQA